MQMLLSRYSIKRNILAGFCLVLSAFAGTAVVTALSIEQTSTTLARSAILTENIFRGEEVGRLFNDTRRHVFQYVERGELAALEEGRKRLGEIRGILTVTMERMANPARKVQVQALLDEVLRYENELRQLQSLREQRDAPIAQLRENGSKIQASLSRRVSAVLPDAPPGMDRDPMAISLAGRALEAVLSARVWAATFAANPTDQAASLVRRNLTDARRRIETAQSEALTAETEEEFGQIRQQLEAYSRSFNVMADNVQSLHDLVTGPVAASAERVLTSLNKLQTERRAALNTLDDEVDHALLALRDNTLMAAITALLVGLGIAALLGRGIGKSLNGLQHVMSRLAEGDLAVQVPRAHPRTEIGRMAEALEVFRDNTLRLRAMEQEAAEAKRRMEAERRTSMNGLADSFEQTVGGIVENVAAAAQQLQGSATSLTAVASQSASQADLATSASAEASSHTGAVAAATEELTASIQEIARQVTESTRITSAAARRATEVDQTVGNLADTASRIGDVVRLIGDIAGQTNLLALNATIEAARAGDAGKGFAVVASEVKSLAAQTAKATEEIGKQIAAIQAETQGAVSAIRDITTVVGQIEETTGAIAAAVEQQQAATQEIARSVQEASQGTQTVQHHLSDMRQAAGSTGSSAGELLNASGELTRRASDLRGAMDAFLAQVRAA